MRRLVFALAYPQIVRMQTSFHHDFKFVHYRCLGPTALHGSVLP